MSERGTALIVRGGWSGHRPVESTELFIPFLRESGYDVQVAETAHIYSDGDLMNSVDLIVQSNSMSDIDDYSMAGLLAAVMNGAGLAGWHGGIIDSYRNRPEYLQLVGGQFVHHPGLPEPERTGDESDYFLPYTVNILPDKAAHSIVRGLADFTLTSEQYWVLYDDYNDVLATTTIPAREIDPWARPVTSPAVWTRAWGRGRVFVATPGHRLEDLDEPTVRSVIERGFLWASRSTERS